MELMFNRKLNEAELENIVLRDPRSRTHRLSHLNFSGTVGTSGRFVHAPTSLLPAIKIINQSEIGQHSTSPLGEGRFGRCYFHTFGHFKVCIKVLKNLDNNALAHEANILSKFFHQNLPYLFGVSIGESPSIISTYHEYKSRSLTVHCALFNKSSDGEIDWKEVLVQIVQGLDQLHNKYRIIHNDLKGDNVVLSSSVQGSLSAVIIDFGKACEFSQAKAYKLSNQQKEHYKLHHPHIAPDLRDGLCKQSPSSDIFSFGRMMNIINASSFLKSDRVSELSQKCMQYNGQLRPDIILLKSSMLEMYS